MDAQKSVDLLNNAVADELQAVHQYMHWHFHLDDQGFGPLSAPFKRIAVMEMTHIETLSERILFLKGDVQMVPAGRVETEPEAILTKAAALERGPVKKYNKFALECSANADAASKHVFEPLMNEEESHFDEFDKQLHNIKRFGLSYMALQSFGTARPQEGQPA